MQNGLFERPGCFVGPTSASVVQLRVWCPPVPRCTARPAVSRPPGAARFGGPLTPPRPAGPAG
eukprot:6104094-Alexandrium_andersonii.AAC.1